MACALSGTISNWANLAHTTCSTRSISDTSGMKMSMTAATWRLPWPFSCSLACLNLLATSLAPAKALPAPKILRKNPKTVVAMDTSMTLSCSACFSVSRRGCLRSENRFSTVTEITASSHSMLRPSNVRSNLHAVLSCERGTELHVPLHSQDGKVEGTHLFRFSP